MTSQNMNKRIWFTQQKPFDYLPLRVGLGLLPKNAMDYENCFMANLCPKIYTTRTHPLRGEYYVVEGSRFKAKPVEPRIEFQVRHSWKLNLRTAIIDLGNGWIIEWGALHRKEKSLDGVNFPDELLGLTFPELDLGIKGTSFGRLIDELFLAYPKAAIDTPFYVSRLDPIEARR